MEIVWFVVVGIAAGWIAGVVMKGAGLGLVGNLVVGVVGALVGGLLFRALGVSMGGGLLARSPSRRSARSCCSRSCDS
jgi:uncharacterized membrane protein YeaQ/YmgE (transglycosylase-associated protein family)